MPLWFAQIKLYVTEYWTWTSHMPRWEKWCANWPWYDTMETGPLRYLLLKFYYYHGNPGVTQLNQALSKQRKIGNHGKEMWLSRSLSHTKPTHQVTSSRRKSGDNKRFKEEAQRHLSKKNFLTLRDGTDRLSRNVGKELPPYAVQYLRRAEISRTRHMSKIQIIFQRNLLILTKLSRLQVWVPSPSVKMQVCRHFVTPFRKVQRLCLKLGHFSFPRYHLPTHSDHHKTWLYTLSVVDTI
jgi:hypothetical protein